MKDARDPERDGEWTEDQVLGHCVGCNAPAVEFDDGTIEVQGCTCEPGWDD